MKEEILLVKISNALKEGKDHYEAIRGNWRMNESRLSNIQYVGGVSHGEIVCLFEPSSWTVIGEGQEKGRKRFEGKEAHPEILSRLQNAQEQCLRKFGRGSAIAYISLAELER